MLSAGNDIVALRSIDKERTGNPRFYRQILSNSEQELFHASVNEYLSFATFVWFAWSVKESAYKYFKRSNPQLVFSPTKIILQKIVSPEIDASILFANDIWESDLSDRSFYFGSFLFEGKEHFFKTKIDDELIATIVSEDENFENIKWGIRKTVAADSHVQSKEVRSYLLNRLSHYFPELDLHITPPNGNHPVVMHNNIEMDIPVSFSHHQSFVSYAFMLAS